MPLRALRLATALLLTAAIGVSVLSARGPQQPQPAPLTMGSLLLLRHSDGTASVPIIQSALRRLFPLRTILAAALAAEQDDDVAAEQVRALMMLGAPDTIAAVEARVETAGPAALLAYAHELARTRPQRLLEQLPFLVERPGPKRASALTSAIRLGARVHPGQQAALLRGWLAHASSQALDALDVPNGLTAPVPREGCIGSARVVGGVDPWLDAEALRTVIQWRYTAPSIGGTAVDVELTVGVNFAL